MGGGVDEVDGVGVGARGQVRERGRRDAGAPHSEARGRGLGEGSLCAERPLSIRRSERRAYGHSSAAAGSGGRGSAAAVIRPSPARASRVPPASRGTCRT